jgi:hypothetical protein
LVDPVEKGVDVEAVQLSGEEPVEVTMQKNMPVSIWQRGNRVTE